MRQGIMGLGLLLILGCSGGTVLAQGYTYQTIDAEVPGLGWTRITGITTLGSMVGTAFDSQAIEYSWLFRRNTQTYEVIRPRGFPVFLIDDLNDQQRQTGTYFKNERDFAFVRSGVNITTIRIPGALHAFAKGISNNNLVIGTFIDTVGVAHAFTYTVATKQVTILDVPGANGTAGHGVNTHGDLVGSYTLGPEHHGWLLRDGEFTRIDAPCGGTSTTVQDINDAGLMAVQCGDDDGNLTSYAYDGETWTELAVPGAFVTFVHRVNAGGQLVGWFSGTDGKDHGFIASPAVNTAAR